MKNILPILVALAAAASPAHADPFAEAVADDLRRNGYDQIEVRSGPRRVRAEGVRGNRRIEVVYDTSTGEIVRLDYEIIDPNDRRRPDRGGNQRSRDRFDDDDRDDDDDDDDDRDDDRDDDDDDDD